MSGHPFIVYKRPRVESGGGGGGDISVAVERAAQLDAESATKEVEKKTTTTTATKTKRNTDVPQPRFADATLRCVFLNASLMSKILLRLGTLGNDIVLDFAPASSEAGLNVLQLHASGVAMAEFNMPRNAFAHYDVAAAVTTPLFYEQVKGFSKACNQTQSLSFYVTPQRVDKLCARMHSTKVDRLRIFDVRESANLDDRPKIPFQEWQYPVIITLSAKVLQTEIKACADNNASFVIFNISKLNDQDALSLTSIADNGSDGNETCDSIVHIDTIERRHGVIIVEQRFVIEFLKIIAGFSEFSDVVTLHFGLDKYPIWFRFHVDSLDDDVFVDVVLACRE